MHETTVVQLLRIAGLLLLLAVALIWAFQSAGARRRQLINAIAMTGGTLALVNMLLDSGNHAAVAVELAQLVFFCVMLWMANRAESKV